MCIFLLKLHPNVWSPILKRRSCELCKASIPVNGAAWVRAPVHQWNFTYIKKIIEVSRSLPVDVSVSEINWFIDRYEQVVGSLPPTSVKLLMVNGFSNSSTFSLEPKA